MVIFLKKYWRDPGRLAEQPLVWQRQLWVPARSPGAMSEQVGARPGRLAVGKQAGDRDMDMLNEIKIFIQSYGRKGEGQRKKGKGRRRGRERKKQRKGEKEKTENMCTRQKKEQRER